VRATTKIMFAGLIGLALLAGPALITAAPPSDVTRVVRGNNRFALKIYTRLARKSGNIVFSPYSLSTALAMTYAGAAGNTAGQMRRVLHFGPPDAALHAGFGRLTRLVTAGQGPSWQLSVANALWPKRGYRLLPKFVETLRLHYGARLRPLNFSADPEASRRTINAWVGRQTKGKITDLLPPRSIKPNTRLVLTNAVYFKGAWKLRFDARLTRPQTFWLAPGRGVKVPMMRQLTARFAYGEFKDLKVLSLPYAGGRMNMVILLPRRVDGLAALERSLTPQALSGWLSRLRRQKVRVWLPRFKLTSRFSLKKTLSALGMPDAFDRVRADFSKMTGGRDLMIDKVLHQAKIEVNEQGTEAAAATAVIMVPRGMVRRPPAFRADRPFLFLIRDERTGSILFMGRVVDPR